MVRLALWHGAVRLARTVPTWARCGKVIRGLLYGDVRWVQARQNFVRLVEVFSLSHNKDKERFYR